ncbi:PAS domain S-box protein [Paenibacillus sp. YYML68]|uniref:PAS domain S-box protein n=1 Tax=Paenibacillus sp. YYML68 TaxID=2909250 RepID=UPI00248F6819|nr:PAS domain S-box protein [Paenibacillus sp. YYML68]
MTQFELTDDYLFTHAFEHAPIGMALVAPDGSWLRVNSSLCDIVGYSELELMQMNFQMLTHEDDLDFDLELVHDTLEGRRTHYQLDKRYYHKHGHVVWVRLSVTLVRDEHRKPLYFIGQIQDITDQKTEAHVLIQSKERYKSLFQCHPDAIMSFSPSGQFTSVNDACERVTGYTKQELLHMDPSVLLERTDVSRKHFLLALEGEPQEFEEIIIHKNGHRVVLRVTYVPIVVESKIEGIYSILKDITEYRKATEQLLHHDQLYELISENAQDVIFSLTAKGTVDYVSPGVKALLGYAAEDVQGHPFFTYVHTEDLQELVSSPLMSQKDSGIVCCRLRHQQGHYVWFEINIKAIQDGEDRLQRVMGIGRDITERKRAEAERIQSEQQLQLSEKLSLAGQLAAGIAHEIRNPLTAIKGFITLLEREYRSKPEYFSVIGSEIERIEQIISELLMLAKPQAAQYESKDIRDIVEPMIKLMEAQALLRNIQLQYDFSDETLLVHCNENQLKQVFINFVKNAIESMPHGGQILITTASADREARTLQITIRDEGEGIPPELLARLGEPFFSTKEKGTGLGYAVSKKIIENHGGTLVIRSTVHVGTEVHIQLPLITQ